MDQTQLTLPTWHLNDKEYALLCRYLNLTPSASIYPKLAKYLGRMGASRIPLFGFDRWLSEIRPGPWSLSFLDIWTRLWFRSNPWRFKLNAMVALHECDGVGFREMSRQSTGKTRIWLEILGHSLGYGFHFILGCFWLIFQFVSFGVVRRNWKAEERAFAGKTVLITGISRGLGLALSRHLLALGAKVVGVSRRADLLEKLKNDAAEMGLGERFLVGAADVAVPGAVSQALSAMGISPSEVAMVIINAGIKTPFQDLIDSETIRRTFEVNVFGAAETLQALLPAWKQKGRGHVVFISSLGRHHGMVSTGAYNASKAALSLLADSLDLDLRAQKLHQIHTTVVEPGLIHTQMVQNQGLQRFLAVDVDKAARRILRAVGKGKSFYRFPKLFALLTMAVALMPQRLRRAWLSQVTSTERIDRQ
ncbi:MAG: SDR family NAD(P)-dependent oxidoreductase [Elusimicrobia bacterium]|nr:SDR family NAD(P)-dependent oxidoreductase [Elusimicrobiota bacterium]